MAGLANILGGLNPLIISLCEFYPTMSEFQFGLNLVVYGLINVVLYVTYILCLDEVVLVLLAILGINLYCDGCYNYYYAFLDYGLSILLEGVVVLLDVLLSLNLPFNSLDGLAASLTYLVEGILEILINAGLDLLCFYDGVNWI